MNRCWPLSTTLPVSGSTKDRARPPRCGRASRTRTRAPSSARSVAAARPANPPPTTIASGILPRPACMTGLTSDFAQRPGAQGDTELLQARHGDAPLEHPEIPPLDTSEELQVDGPHHLRGDETGAIGLRQEAGRAVKVAVGPFRLAPHEIEIARSALPAQKLRLAVTASGDFVQGQVDATARGVGLEVPEDVRELQGDPEIDGVGPAPAVAAAEDRQADQTHGRGHPEAIDPQLLEVPVACLPEVHRHTVEEVLERLPGDSEASDRRLEVPRHREHRRAAVAAGDLLAVHLEPLFRAVRIERPLVRQVVDRPAEGIDRLDAAFLLPGEEAEGVTEGRPGGGAATAGGSQRRARPRPAAARRHPASHRLHVRALPRMTRASAGPSLGRADSTSWPDASIRSRIRWPPSQISRSSQRNRPRTASHRERPGANSARVRATLSRMRARNASVARPDCRSDSVTPNRLSASSGR